MCKAFSGVIKENCVVLWKMGMDSHDDIIMEHGLRDDTAEPDRLRLARFEISPANGSYLNPNKWVFKLDEKIKPTWWGPGYEKACWDAHKEWLKKLNRILVKKPIINPFTDRTPPKKITKKHLDLLKQWASVRDSVRDSVRGSFGDSVWYSVRDSVGYSVRGSVGDSVWYSVRNSVWYSVGYSVRDSVGNSVWYSVRDSVWYSIRDSVDAYSGSFFKLPRKAWVFTDKIKTRVCPFQPVVDLWIMGLVSSFDGNVWRLHGGPKAEILWEGKI
jgi:hypothetical protein